MRFVAVALTVLLAACGSQTGASKQHLRNGLRGAGSVTSRFAGVEQRGAALGSAQAPFTMVEFADLQCPFCSLYDRQVLPAVIAEFVRSGRLRLELRPIRFLGPDSAPAGAAAVAAGFQNRMWQFADVFYRNQGPENSGYVTPTFIARVGAAVPGLDIARVRRDAGSAKALAILADNERAAQTARLTGTPGFRLGRTGDVLTPFEGRGLGRADFLRRLRQLVAG